MDWITEIYDIFSEVQKSQIFDDQKYFADSTPKVDLDTIQLKYIEIDPKNTAELREFVLEYFQPPKVCNATIPTSENIEDHIDKLWDILKRKNTQNKSTLIGVPHAYVLPGGRFRESYYWDSYFTMIGLKQSGKFQLIRDMVDNFASLINLYGFIPNGTRTYFLSRSQPPFFSYMIELLASIDGEGIYVLHKESLRKEYAFWMDHGVPEQRHCVIIDNIELNRYYDTQNTPRPESFIEDISLYNNSKSVSSDIYKHIRSACESGWDFSSRWLANPHELSSIETMNIIPVDLNCLLYHMESTLWKAYKLSGKYKEANAFEKISIERANAINNTFWNKRNGFYQDYNIRKSQLNNQNTLAGLFPLYVNVASNERANRVLDVVESQFLAYGGLLTTLVNSGQQWDAPNSWAPLQYIGYISAINYGRRELANKIKENWTQNVERVYAESGKLMEKYNAIDPTTPAGGGEYPNQDGFGWTNAIYKYFKSITT